MRFYTLLLLFPPAWAYQDTTASADYKISTTVDLVMIDAGVKDSANRFVTDLTQADFHVFDNGHEQAIRYFGKSDLPVTVGLVIDNSGSMASKKAMVDRSAIELIRASNPQDQVFTVQFNDSVKFGLPEATPFTSSIPDLESALARGPSVGRTTLYDATAASLRHLTQGSNGRKALVLVSDGGDNASKSSLPVIKTLVESSSAAIYTVGIFDEDDEEQKPGVLKELAAMSGGQYFRVNSLEELPGICQSIAAAIRNTYTLAYTPPADAHPSLHHVKVSATGGARGRLTVRARSSYLSHPGVTSAAGQKP